MFKVINKYARTHFLNKFYTFFNIFIVYLEPVNAGGLFHLRVISTCFKYFNYQSICFPLPALTIHIISAHENTLVAIYILYLRGFNTELNEPQSSYENIKSIIKGLGSSNFEDIKVAVTTLKNTLCDKNIVEKLERFKENRKNNITFQFLMKYKDMVTILLKFINAS